MSLRARDIMTTEIITVSPEMKLIDLENKFLEEKISGAPVVEDGRLVGVISRSDLIRLHAVNESFAENLCDFYQNVGLGSTTPRLSSAGLSFTDIGKQVSELMENKKVRDAMIHKIITASPDAHINELAHEMLEKHIHRILITTGERLEGIVSASDLMRLLADGPPGKKHSTQESI
jgi:CBS domain-containing protein